MAPGIDLSVSDLVRRFRRRQDEQDAQGGSFSDGSRGLISRSVVVGAGRASYLTLSENFNRGWSARLRGRSLEPVRIDGWRQGWLVPAGSGGTVSLTFGPDRLYRDGLVAGAVLALLAIGLALIPGRPHAPGEHHFAPSEWRPAFAIVAATVVTFLLGGWLALTVPLLLFVPRRHVVLPWIAFSSLCLAGVVAAANAGAFPASGAGTFSA